MKWRLTVLMTGILIYSCLNPFAPALTDDDPGGSLIITARRSPEEVLTNFRYAYAFKDSLIYSDVLDSTFLFISKNYGTNPPTDINWGRDVDLKTTAALFRHFDVLELNWGGILYYDFSGDSTESEMKITFQLTLDGGREIPTVKGEALFNFRRRPAGTWTITRWEDLSSF
jgi:hypothetical protein